MANNDNIDDNEFELIIPEEYRAWCNPEVLKEIARDIEAKVASEAANPIKYKRYIEVMANHIMKRALKSE